jgi:hypothetical protein
MVAHYERLGANKYRLNLSMWENGRVLLRQFWFSGWQARVDSREVRTEPSGVHAVVSCEVPPGNHMDSGWGCFITP